MAKTHQIITDQRIEPIAQLSFLQVRDDGQPGCGPDGSTGGRLPAQQ
jgi:hypothetical protein